MPTLTTPIIIATVVCLCLSTLAVIFLPFVAAAFHITYTLDNAALTIVIGALTGVIGTLIARKSGDNGNNTEGK